jgi:hypothetical protein
MSTTAGSGVEVVAIDTPAHPPVWAGQSSCAPVLFVPSGDAAGIVAPLRLPIPIGVLASHLRSQDD